jgi:hypothetical protein
MAGGGVSIRFMIVSAPRARCISLAAIALSWMARRRSTGSSMSVASDTGMPEMAFPVTTSPSLVRTLTGTEAARGTSGSSWRAESQLRREPAQMASITSLIFTSKAFFTAFMSSSDTEQ